MVAFNNEEKYVCECGMKFRLKWTWMTHRSKCEIRKWIKKINKLDY